MNLVYVKDVQYEFLRNHLIVENGGITFKERFCCHTYYVWEINKQIILRRFM